MMKALKNVQFAWIFVGNGSHTYKILIFLRFDLADCTDILRDRICLI